MAMTVMVVMVIMRALGVNLQCLGEIPVLLAWCCLLILLTDATTLISLMPVVNIRQGSTETNNVNSLAWNRWTKYYEMKMHNKFLVGVKCLDKFTK
jgi:hypothetical protein